MITAILPFQLGGTHFTCEVRYDEHDPYALHFVFKQTCADSTCTEDHETTWVIGRELVADGMESDTYVGEGDIRIRRDSHTTVQIWLNSNEGMAHVNVPYRPLKSFIARTIAAVNLGKESEHLDWDDFDQERVTWS